VKKTNFLQDLYTDEELTPAYLKEGRDNKTLFMKKLVTAVCKSKDHRILQEKSFVIYSDIAVKRPPDVRVSKILAGQEADKTNLLLQALAEAINLDVDSKEVVRKTLQSLGETNDNEEPPPRSRDNKDQEKSERHRSKEERSSKSHEREEPPPERKSSSRDTSKVKIKISILIYKNLSLFLF
jgi:TRAF3-interacting protein 1